MRMLYLNRNVGSALPWAKVVTARKKLARMDELYVAPGFYHGIGR